MSVELGHFALVLALALAVVQTVVPFAGARLRHEPLMRMGEPAAVTSLALVMVSFAALVIAYVQSDFSVLNVWENSHSAKPLLFKITGTWGNHEGSMLLWVMIQSTTFPKGERTFRSRTYCLRFPSLRSVYLQSIHSSGSGTARGA